VLVDRAEQRAGAGVEHQDARPVHIDELPGGHRVSRVGGHRGERVADLGLRLLQAGLVAGDADDAGAGAGQRGGDGAAEAAAGPGDDGGGSGDVGGHVTASRRGVMAVADGLPMQTPGTAGLVGQAGAGYLAQSPFR
jgi:hypothetical protein